MGFIRQLLPSLTVLLPSPNWSCQGARLSLSCVPQAKIPHSTFLRRSQQPPSFNPSFSTRDIQPHFTPLGGDPMNKKIKIALLFGGTALLSAYAIHAMGHNKGTVEPIPCSVQPVVFSSLEEIQWAKSCVTQYPEILWLADEKVRTTEEGLANPHAGAYSEMLFGKKHIEFDRTLMTLLCLKLALDGSDRAYEEFTQIQPSASRLTRESFDALHLQGKKLLESRWEGLSREEMAQAMETSLILGDIGKSEQARVIFKPYGATAPDHDDFHGEAMPIIAQRPELSPSFQSLPSAAKQLLLKTTNLAHFGHVTHLEGGPQILEPLAESRLVSSDPVAFDFAFFVHTCDVAGALGHVNNRSSVTYTQLTHQAVQGTKESVKVLSDPQKKAEDAYFDYVAKRASWVGLNAEIPGDRVLARIAAMLRLFTPEEGAVLREGMERIDEVARMEIIANLDAHNRENPGRTPTYMPALLVNLANNAELGETPAERLSHAISIGLPFISRVLDRHQKMLANGEADPNIPLNFNPIAGIAKSTPDALAGEFNIEADGRVLSAKL